MCVGGEIRYVVVCRYVKWFGWEFWIGFGEDWRMLIGGIVRL